MNYLLSVKLAAAARTPRGDASPASTGGSGHEGGSVPHITENTPFVPPASSSLLETGQDTTGQIDPIQFTTSEPAAVANETEISSAQQGNSSADLDLAVEIRSRRSSPVKNPKKRKNTAYGSSSSFHFDEDNFGTFVRQFAEVGELTWKHLQQKKVETAKLNEDLQKSVAENSLLKSEIKELKAKEAAKDATILSQQSAHQTLQQSFDQLSLERTQLQQNNRDLEEANKKLKEEHDANLAKATQLRDQMAKSLADMEAKQKISEQESIRKFKASTECSQSFGVISGPLVGYGFTLGHDETKKFGPVLENLPSKVFYGPQQDVEAGRRFEEFARGEDVIAKYAPPTTTLDSAV